LLAVTAGGITGATDFALVNGDRNRGTMRVPNSIVNVLGAAIAQMSIARRLAGGFDFTF